MNEHGRLFIHISIGIDILKMSDKNPLKEQLRTRRKESDPDAAN